MKYTTQEHILQTRVNSDDEVKIAVFLHQFVSCDLFFVVISSPSPASHSINTLTHLLKKHCSTDKMLGTLNYVFIFRNFFISSPLSQKGFSKHRVRKKKRCKNLRVQKASEFKELQKYISSVTFYNTWFKIHLVLFCAFVYFIFITS